MGPGDGIFVSLVLARAQNGVIGANGALPWRQKADMAHFRAVTRGKPVIMGRKTWDSLKGPLKDRDNIVLTRASAAPVGGAWFFSGLDAALACGHARAAARGVQEICIIGGAEMYRQVLPAARRIHLTEVLGDPPGDTVMAPFDAGEWRSVSVRDAPAGPDDQYPVRFRDLERIAWTPLASTSRAALD